MKGIWRPIATGLIGALAVTAGAIFPLPVMLPIALVACAIIIGSAILSDRRDARKLRA